MRIAFISTLKSSQWGGSEFLWYYTAKLAIANNHDIGVFIYDWGELNPELSFLKSNGAEIFKRKIKKNIIDRLSKLVLDRLNIKIQYKKLKKFNPDIIVVTDGCTFYSSDDLDLQRILCKEFSKKYVIVTQSNGIFHRPYKRLKAIELFKNALDVFFVSQANRDLCFHQLAYDNFPNKLIQNPVNFDRNFIPVDIIPKNKIHIAVVGRLSIADKGQDIIISMLNDNFFKSEEVVIHLYGKGEDEQYLRDLAEFYGVESMINFEGYTDKHLIWSKCQLLLLCSHKEGTPLTLLEAMSHGRICIVTDAGGNKEWITDSYNGYISKSASRDMLADKLREAIKNKNKWNIISNRAITTIKSKVKNSPELELFNYIINY